MMVVIRDEGDGDGNSVWFVHFGFTAALLVFIAGAHSS